MWSIHPKYLDRQGLTACWREALLAQAVLAGRKKGYARHPQLERFRSCEDPLAAVGVFLTALHQEAAGRGYRFDLARIDRPGTGVRIEVTDGQVAFERDHLLGKLRQRSPELVEGMEVCAVVDVHPMFDVVRGDVASWERR